MLSTPHDYRRRGPATDLPVVIGQALLAEALGCSYGIHNIQKSLSRAGPLGHEPWDRDAYGYPAVSGRWSTYRGGLTLLELRKGIPEGPP